MKEEKQMSRDGLAALKERLARRTSEEMAAEEADPKFMEGFAAWEREYRATVAMYKARQEAGLSQAEVARRMHVPRASVYRIEKGQNVTIATLTRYLRACGFDFSFSIFPIGAREKSEALAMA